LVAAAHDLGKLVPSFQEKIFRHINIVHNLANPDLDEQIGYHSAVSQATVPCGDRMIPGILGRHHGYSPAPAVIFPPNAEVYGGTQWQNLRETLIILLKEAFATDWPEIRPDIQADVIAGLCSVADWIGSGPLFDDPQESWEPKIGEAVDRAGFIPPALIRDLKFSDLFPFSPSSLQEVFIGAVHSPGVYILEAPMGCGKTEAALFAAYRMLESTQASGIYFALPTQLTSDTMFSRFREFLNKILAPGDPHHRSLLLLHGSALLTRTEWGEEGQPGFPWFNSLKRGLLAPFAVGTIDQALMAIMNVKHGFVRAFGLAGKVVILDEVHSYDTFTGTLLDHLVAALRQLGCTVIVLSATLSQARRADLLGDAALPQQFSSPGYPTISGLPEGSPDPYKLDVAHNERAEVVIQHIADDRLALEEAIARGLTGEQVLWIENTVDDAQHIFRILGSRVTGSDIECGLLHSRFIKKERIANEKRWVSLYGKYGGQKRDDRGRILVGTQVLEQSIDIDADFLITRAAPSDMLLQRIGRLWRHRAIDPIRPATARRQVWLLAQPFSSIVVKPDLLGKSALVYAPYVLLRTLEIWKDFSSLTLPEMIRPIIEATYGERSDEGLFFRFRCLLEEERAKLRRFALLSTATAGQTLLDTDVTTRYAEEASLDVLLLRSIKKTEDGTAVRFLDDSELLVPSADIKASSRQKREIAGELLRNSLNVVAHKAPDTPPALMQWLRGFVYLGTDRTQCMFRAALVDQDGTLFRLDHGPVHNKYKLLYNTQTGYSAI